MNNKFITIFFTIITFFHLVGSNYCCKYEKYKHSDYESLMKIVKSFPEKDQILVKNCLKARAEYQDIPGSSFYIAPPESDESFLGQLINSILCSSANK